MGPCSPASYKCKRGGGGGGGGGVGGVPLALGPIIRAGRGGGGGSPLRWAQQAGVRCLAALGKKGLGGPSPPRAHEGNQDTHAKELPYA